MAPVLSTPLLRTQSDGRLVALAADGHDRAFEAIVERYRRPLQRYLRRLLSEALAEDVLQASFVRAWQALRAGTEVRELRPWLYRIAHNQALNTLRAAGAALPAVAAELPAISLEAEVERREELRAALHGIEALPDRQRAALVAIAVADRPHADVARELGMSDGALRQLLLRARTTLRAAATALTPYPMMSWLAGGQEATAARVAEAAVGAGGAGVALKAGVAALAAGAVVAGGPTALRSDHHSAPASAQSGAREADRQAGTRRDVALTQPAPTPDHEAGDQGGAAVDPAGHAPATGSGSSADSGRIHAGSTPHHSGSSGSSGSGSGSGSSTKSSGSGGSESGASGSDDDGGSNESGSGSGSGESSGKGSSGKGTSGDDGAAKEHSGKESSGKASSGKESKASSGKDDAPVAPATQPAPVGGDDGTDAPTVTIAPPPSDSDEGSDSSGSSSGSSSGHSGSSGSGSDDSGED